MLFLEVSVIISDDLYEMLVLFGSLPLTKKYIHHNLFSLGKNLSALFGAVIFWSKTWNQGITCWFLSWDPADFADVFAPKPSIKKCSAPLAFFFLNRALANRPTKKTRSCLFSGWKEGTIPHGSKYRMTEQFWWPKKNSACHICLSVQGLGLGRRTVSSVAKVLVENWVEMT